MDNCVLDNIKTVINDDIDVWDTRTINLICDPNRCIGQTSIVEISCVSDKIKVIHKSKCYKDIMKTVIQCQTSKLYMIDMTKDAYNDEIQEAYSAIEQIKDGHAWDNRYHAKERWFNSPNIWVFCNKLPNMDLLSKDRWKIWELKDKSIVVNNKNK
jgi:hypothetical protein